jgi:flap endonuclease-1
MAARLTSISALSFFENPFLVSPPQLTRLLGDNAPGCVKEHDLKSYFGRKVAIDASMSIYQFLVAVRSGADNFTNADGEVTSHLMGLFYRTVRLIELGIKPVYVFDGKPPPMKSGELAKRRALKAANEAAAAKADEDGDAELAEKFSRRVNKVTPEIIASCKTLCRLMGVPVVEAPCEAEAQCAELCKEGKVYATATEDMDARVRSRDSARGARAHNGPVC